ncbi:4a-hydroxytetrahydrobiopterin dehydratase [Burkholderiales bacterium]|nr:4a-hydroxytetrahydrobiopterin dehydratase [Burkholderiales bacterium]
MRRILSNVGENPARDGLLNTPKRVRRMYGELPGVVTCPYSLPMRSLLGWEVRANQLVRTYTLPSFTHAIMFIGAIGQLAEAANHHPDLRLFGYRHVTIELTTHSAGGLTRRDFDLARQIQALPHKQPK